MLINKRYQIIYRHINNHKLYNKADPSFHIYNHKLYNKAMFKIKILETSETKNYINLEKVIPRKTKIFYYFGNPTYSFHNYYN